MPELATIYPDGLTPALAPASDPAPAPPSAPAPETAPLSPALPESAPPVAEPPAPAPALPAELPPAEVARRYRASLHLPQSTLEYLDYLATDRGARQPATVGETWHAEFARAGLDTVTGTGQPLMDSMDELFKGIEKAAGKPLSQYASEKGMGFAGVRSHDDYIKKLNDIADTLPEDKRKMIAPLRDVRGNAVKKAQEIERHANEVSAFTYGLAGTATAWAAGIARQSIDPVNIAAMVATAPLGGPVTGAVVKGGLAGAAKLIGREAVANMAGQALVEPIIEPARAELGLESGVGRAATNILEAGAGGAVVGAGGVVLHKLFRRAADAYRGARPGDAAIHPNMTAEDFDAAALLAERNAVTGAPQGADPVAHADGLQQAERSMEEGTPPPVPPTADASPPPAHESLSPIEAQPELPLPKPIEPIEPRGAPAAVKDTAEVVGDPALARDLDGRLATMPEADTRIFHIEQPDKTIKSGPAKSFLQEVADDAKAVNELIDCIG